MKKIIVLSICMIVGILVYRKNGEIIIPNDAIRIRIIANSNSIKDLSMKKKIKNKIKNDLYNLVNQANSSSEANDIIDNNLDNIEKIVSNYVNDYQINYGVNHFPNKTYKGVLYPEGDYKSLVISLGKGLGDNWWCVLYPPLCLLEDNDEIDDVQYRLLISKILNN